MSGRLIKSTAAPSNCTLRPRWRTVQTPCLATAAAISILKYAAANCCVSEQADDLRPTILNAYARAARHWSTHDYDWRDEQYAAFTAALLRWATAPDRTTLTELATELAAVPGALAEFLHALVFAATYDRLLVEPLARTWPQLMQIGARHRDRARSGLADYREAHRQPHPRANPAPWDGDIDATLVAARTHWLGIEQVRDHIEPWLRHARGERACVDTVGAENPIQGL